MYRIEDGVYKLKQGQVKEGLITIASGKGRVGKSTLTVNLAIALKKLNKEVGIIDADVLGFSIPRILGLKEEAFMINEKEIIPSTTKDGIKIISMGSFLDEENPIIWRGPLLVKALEQFMEDVSWGELDYLLFDLPPGTGDMPLNIMQRLKDAKTIVVTTPQITATNVAGRIGKMAEKLDIDILGVIENMSYYLCSKCNHKEYIFGQGGGVELANKLNTSLLGQLPLITAIREGGDKGSSIISDNPDSVASKELIIIAEKIIERVN